MVPCCIFWYFKKLSSNILLSAYLLQAPFEIKLIKECIFHCSWHRSIWSSWCWMMFQRPSEISHYDVVRKLKLIRNYNLITCLLGVIDFLKWLYSFFRRLHIYSCVIDSQSDVIVFCTCREVFVESLCGYLGVILIPELPTEELSFVY